MLTHILLRLPDENSTLAELEKAGSTKTTGGTERGRRLVREEVLPMLRRLGEDGDVDVRFFAGVGVKGAEGGVE